MLLKQYLVLLEPAYKVFLYANFRYKGNYYRREVAIKVLKPELLNTELFKEFYQELNIMRFSLPPSLSMFVMMRAVVSSLALLVATLETSTHRNVY